MLIQGKHPRNQKMLPAFSDGLVEVEQPDKSKYLQEVFMGFFENTRKPGVWREIDGKDDEQWS